MRLLLDDDLVEAAVFRAATRRRDLPAPAIRRFHAAREQAYGALDPDERNTAFARVHRAFFREWGLEAILLQALERFPLLAQTLHACAFRSARAASDEGADLYVNPEGERHAIVALTPSRIESTAAAAPFLNHELQHVHDMVDPAFGYAPDLPGDPLTPLRQRLVRDRYRLLWNITVDGRLTHRGLPTLANRDRRLADFSRAFAFLTEADALFSELWERPQPTHHRLLELAHDPRGMSEAKANVPGAPCPLCGFPTFAWADATLLSSEILGRVRRDRPEWTPADGLCQRCAEVHVAAGAFAFPPTMVV